ncbi:MAG: hypothetical protein HY208_05785 [Nitrospirae bacterium]|nr:hypothetical protein [Nitrospirota bacterium]
MKKNKFNCVAMKHEIQERQRKRLKGLSPVEESRVIRTEILKDCALSRLWKAAGGRPFQEGLGRRGSHYPRPFMNRFIADTDDD